MSENDESLNEEDNQPTAPIKKSTRKKRSPQAAKPKREFPLYSLDECRKIADALKEFNAGNPWSPAEIAKALNLGTGKSTSFYYLTAAARDYGLTTGTRDSQKIDLTDLGRSVVYPKSPLEQAGGVLSSFLNVELFKKVYEYYQGKNLPEIEYLKNTLKTEFGIDDSLQDDFYKIYQKNLNYVRTNQGDTSEAVSNNLPHYQSDSSIVLGESKTPGKLVAFVAMPFSEKTSSYANGYFDEVLKHLITPAAVKAGFTAKTAKKAGSEVIQSTIVNDLDAADLVIVDLTEHNPNVLFELGMRIAFNKPVCLIRAKGTAPIFDIDHMLRVYDYNPCLWTSTIEIDIPNLSEHIRETWANKSERSYLTILRENKN
ncbi:nucleoside 2-deoxyribosyltransferase [Erwiniaceae bacterium BAC15a-03b]|uniref:Nucleoside 2-deoxyribosyltransferase n=1 Tax=Winslowiella arboricola TaxID=2978220 RepID=A0A9J6PZ67_9GAMM|nr:hypothetical protein [Winslowiella arboricola]MCU5775855.1 nucleoside 2-deoxyribosyltransferase [Winslowiella arboricola]MCU5779295.1 nucleoside 2-deoxyribosyltransferase [Winslowiella arboricola]